MMVKKYDELVKISHNSNWLQIQDHLYWILIIGGSGSVKTNVLLNLIKHQRPKVDKIYSYAKYPFKSNYKLLINRRKKVGVNKAKKPKTFIDYSETADDIYENLEDYNPGNKRKRLIALDYMIAGIEGNKNFKSYGILLKGTESQYLTCLYITILF